MKRFILFVVVLLSLERTIAAPDKEDIQSRQRRFTQNWFPFRLLSGFFGWFSDSGVDGSPLAAWGEGGASSDSTKTSTKPALRILDPIRNVVSKASKAASSSWAGMRNQIQSMLNAVSDFLVNEIPYAEETTKLPGQRLPEYARGDPIPDYDNLGVEREWKYNDWTPRHDRGSDQVSAKGYGAPEQVYRDYTNGQQGKNYDLYQSVEGTTFDQIKDYEQLLENQIRLPVKESTKKNPFTAFSTLYKKLRQKDSNHMANGR